jgi:hypothetical protein
MNLWPKNADAFFGMRKKVKINRVLDEPETEEWRSLQPSAE